MTSFALRGKTGDGVPLFLGGLCTVSPDADAISELQQALQKAIFAPVDGDPYLTDVKVHRVVTQAAASCAWVKRSVAVLGAVAPFSDAESGAVLGSPFSAPESADGQPESLGNGCYAVCHPGRYGASFCARSPEEAAHLLHRLEEATVQDALNDLQGVTFLLVCDAAARHPGCLFYGNGQDTVCLRADEEKARKELL